MNPLPFIIEAEFERTPPGKSAQILPGARGFYSNERVLRAAEVLRKEDFHGLGRLMYSSHASLRDDFEISTPELDAFVEAYRETGALGARLTGGFGGCAIALLPADETWSLKGSVRRKFESRGFKNPPSTTFTPPRAPRL